MRYVIAGFAVGYLMGLVLIGLGALVLVRYHQELRSWQRRVLPAGITLTGLAIPLSALLFLLSGLVGLLFGLLYRAFLTAFPGPGLASPNLVYSLFTLSVALAFSWLLVPLRRAWRPLAALLLAFAALFGWLLPWLAS